MGSQQCCSSLPIPDMILRISLTENDFRKGKWSKHLLFKLVKQQVASILNSFKSNSLGL